jgi:hypothetical protein
VAIIKRTGLQAGFCGLQKSTRLRAMLRRSLY